SRWWTPLLLVVIFSVILAWMSNLAWDARGDTVSWSELKTMVAQGEIADVVIAEHTVRAQRTVNGRVEPVDVVRVQHDETFIPLLEANGVAYRAERPSPCGDGSMLLFFPLLLLAGLWMMMGRQGGDARGVAAF